MGDTYWIISQKPRQGLGFAVKIIWQYAVFQRDCFALLAMTGGVDIFVEVPPHTARQGDNWLEGDVY
jgi:hypothetical protein